MSQRIRPKSQTPLTRRLGLYFVGVAIGLVLVGFLMSTRRLMTQGSGGTGAGTTPAQPSAPPADPPGSP